MKKTSATELEREIVQHLANGLTASEVAKKGRISVSAMESKVQRLREKWNLKSVAALCVLFYKNKWIE